jgi:O-antigen/teichoic acid export membrane protein
MSSLGIVGKNSLIFGLGRSISSLATIIAIPIYSRVILPEEYGVYALINGLLLSVIVLAGCGLSSSVVRFYYESEPGEIVKNIVTAQLISGTIFSLCGLMLMPLLKIWNLAEYASIALTAVPLILLENFIVVQLSFYRIRQEAWRYALVSIFQRWIGIGLTIFLLFQHWGISSLFIGLIVADFGLVLFFIFSEWKDHLSAPFSSLQAKNFLIFGVPIAFDSVIFSTFQLSDRYILGMYHSLEDVGVYSFLYDVSLKAQFLIVLPMTQVVEPMFWSEIKKIGVDKAKKFISQATQYYFIVTGIIAGLVMLYSNEIFKVFGSERYVTHELLLPVLTFALLLYGVFYIVRIGIFYEKKTSYLFLLTLSITAVKILLNLIIIPLYGVLAAAWSTLAGYVILTIAAYRVSNRFLKIEYSFLRNSIGVIVLLFVAYEMSMLLSEPIISTAILKGTSYIFFSGIVFLVLFKNVRERIFKSLSFAGRIKL